MKKLGATTLFLFIVLSASAQKLRPALNLIKGSTYALLIKQNTTTSQTIRERPLETRLMLTANVSFTVTDFHDSLFYIKAKYDSINLNMDLPNGNLQFSSEQADRANLYAQVLAGLKALPFEITLSKSGKVIAADGAGQNLLKVIHNLKADSAQQEQALSQLQPSLGGDAIKSIIEKVMRIFPPYAVSKTDRWEIESTVPGEPPLVTRNFYLIKNISALDITIQGNGTVQSVLSTDATLLNGMPVKRNLAGTTTSLFTINKKTGWPKSAEVTQNLKGNILIADNPKLPGGLAIPIVIINNLTVTSP